MERIECVVVDAAPAEAIIGLYQAGGWWEETPRARAVVPALIKGSFCFVVARTTSGRIVGMGRVISDGVSDAYIQDLVVLPEFRGRGVGRAIVALLLDRCRVAGLEWIGLIAEAGTASFYQPLGFTPLAGCTAMRCVARADR